MRQGYGYVRAHAKGVGGFAAEKCEAGVVVRPVAYGCVSTRGHTRCRGRATNGARGGAVRAARGQQQSQQLRAQEGDTVRHVYLLSQVGHAPGPVVRSRGSAIFRRRSNARESGLVRTVTVRATLRSG